MTPTQKQIFISHSSKDRDLANLLCLQLESEKISCWIAPRDIPAGVNYPKALADAIDECPVFLLLYSVNAQASVHVINEVERGVSHRKELFVVQTDDADPASNEEISIFVGRRQKFDASRGALSIHLGQLVRELRALLEQADSSVSDADSHPDLAVAVPAVTSVPVFAEPKESITGSIGIEVGAETIRACVIDVSNQQMFGPFAEKTVAVEPAMRNPLGLLSAVRDLATALIDEYLPSTPPVGIGIGLPGQVDVRAGALKFGPNLFGARNLPFRTFLSQAFPGVPVRVDNDVRCATRCELHLGVGIQYDSFAWIFVGAGVGAATVIDRRIHFGNNFCAGEIGHTKVALSGPPCSCGQIGCLETFVKAQAVLDRARAIAIDWQTRGKDTALNSSNAEITSETVLHALEVGDPAAREIAAQIGERLGMGIANYINVVNPAAIVIGGGLMNTLYYHMISEITLGIQRNALAEVANTPIVQSSFADAGVMIGAALMFDPRDGWPFP
jgi:predicted NBD/HSP70 family sugar kinase